MILKEYEEMMEQATKGLTALSTGICPGCMVCMSDYGYDDSEAFEFEDEISSGKLTNEPHCSRSPCYICGCSIGGDREVGHFVDDRDRIIHIDDICIDCVLFLANGDIPDYVAAVTDSNWEHIADAGPHAGHHLHCDDMQDVHCVECGVVLTDEEADAAWPVSRQLCRHEEDS